MTFNHFYGEINPKIDSSVSTSVPNGEKSQAQLRGGIFSRAIGVQSRLIAVLGAESKRDSNRRAFLASKMSWNIKENVYDYVQCCIRLRDLRPRLSHPWRILFSQPNFSPCHGGKLEFSRLIKSNSTESRGKARKTPLAAQTSTVRPFISELRAQRWNRENANLLKQIIVYVFLDSAAFRLCKYFFIAAPTIISIFTVLSVSCPIV